MNRGRTLRGVAASLTAALLVAGTEPVAAAQDLAVRLQSQRGGDCVASDIWIKASGEVYRFRAVGTRIEVGTVEWSGSVDTSVDLGSIALAGPIGAMKIQDGFAYVALQGGQLVVIDFRDPTHPVTEGQGARTLEKPAQVIVDANLVHVLDANFIGGPSTLVSFDVTNHASPVVESEFTSPYPVCAAAGGKLAVPVDFGVQIFNTATAPYTFAGFAPGFPLAMEIASGHLLMGSFSGIEIYSLAGGPPLGYVPMPLPVLRFATEGRRTLAVDVNATIHQVVWTNPAAPTIHGSFATASDPANAGEVVHLDLVTLADGSHVGSCATGYEALHFAFNGDLEEANVTRTFTGGRATAVDALGGITAIGWGGGGLELWSPHFRQPFEERGNRWIFRGLHTDVEVDLSKRVSTSPRGIDAVREGVGPEAAPRIVTAGARVGSFRMEIDDLQELPEISPAFAWDAAVAMNSGEGSGAPARLAYVLEHPAGLRIYDVTDEASPTYVGESAAYSGDATLAARDGLVAIAQPWAGLALLDVTDPALPSQIALVGGSFRAVAFLGNRLYAATPDGFSIYDITDPSLPTWLGGRTVSPGAHVSDLRVERRALGGGGRSAVVWIAAGPDGIFAYDAADPETPVEIAAYDTPGQALSIAIERDQVFVADGTAGVMTLVLETAEDGADLAVLSVDAARRSAPSLASAPNPFRGSTSISFATTRSGVVTLDVMDVAGRRVASLLSGNLDAGTHGVAWNGRDLGGARVPSGCYFVRVSSPEGVTTQKIVALN